jgi:WD40 repeat protein
MADGKTILAGLADGTVKIVDAAKGEVKKSVQAHDSVVTAVVVSADGKRIATGCSDYTIKVWTELK